MRAKKFEVIPAVDLKSGRCVRLHQGRPDRETEYSADPVEMALRWESKGADRLHLVDLDGALTGNSENRPVIREIISQLEIPCQVGGGLRSRESLELLFNWGAAATIVGTAGLEDPGWLSSMIDEFGTDRIYAGVDCKDGKVMVSGWKESSPLERDEWLERLKSIGVNTVVYTEISRDGTEAGPDFPRIEDALSNFNLEFIASGGVGKLEHVEKLARFDYPNLSAVIVGRALYEGSIGLAEALAVTKESKGDRADAP